MTTAGDDFPPQGIGHNLARADFLEVQINQFVTDFGGLRRATPLIVHRMPAAFPSALLGSGRRLTIRGSGHSCDGQTVTDGELLVTYAPATAGPQVRDLGDGLTEVPAGMSWYSLERYLNRQGRTIPVLTDYLHMSIGGTLSVGGAGVDSARYGMQVDQVERIQLIDGTGTSRWCSRTDHPELFRFALGGLGTVGLIERAVLRTAPHRSYIHAHHTYHATWPELAEHTERVAQQEDVDFFRAWLHDGMIGSLIGWRRSARTECGAENCAFVPNHPAARHHGVPASPPGRVRLWTDYVVPAEQITPMLAAVETLRHRSPLGRVLTMLYLLAIRRPPDPTPFAFAPAGTSPVSIGLGVYTSVDRDADTIAAIRNVFRELLERCCDLGGRPYLYGTHDLDDSLAERLYGPDLDQLAKLRSAHRLEHINAHLPIVKAAARNA